MKYWQFWLQHCTTQNKEFKEKQLIRMLHLFKNLVILLLCSLKAHQNKQRGDNSHTFLGLLPIPVPSHPNKKLSQTDRRNNYRNQQGEQKVPKGGKPFIFNHSSLFCSIFKVKQLLLCDHVILLQGHIFEFHWHECLVLASIEC